MARNYRNAWGNVDLWQSTGANRSHVVYGADQHAAADQRRPHNTGGNAEQYDQAKSGISDVTEAERLHGNT